MFNAGAFKQQSNHQHSHGAMFNLHVLGSIWIELRELWRRVFRAMGSRVTDHHHYRSMGIHPLRRFEIIDAVISDQICEIVLKQTFNTKTRIAKCIAYTSPYHSASFC